MEWKILIFAMDGGNLLAGGSCFLFDGTFKSCSSLFCQLYTIHVDSGSTEERTNIIPAVYALLPDKKEATYKRFFFLLKNKIKNFLQKNVFLILKLPQLML